MRLVIVHFHLRPGGVRRIIELAAPFLAERFQAAPFSVTLATGEAPETAWLAGFQRSLPQIPVEVFYDQALAYPDSQERGRTPGPRGLKAAFDRLFHNANDTVVWCHNPSVGRNLALSRELVRSASARKIPVVLHHHDWWFDNRWGHWPGIQKAGFRTFQQALKASFPAGPGLCHIAINAEDARALEQCCPGAVQWMPNLAIRPPSVSRSQIVATRRWLHTRAEVPKAPVWLAPCRLLRRKNLAESLLLTRWLAPEAWLVTTGGPSSPQEFAYADALQAAASQHHWPLRLGCLAGVETPSVPELLAASDAVIITSILEGFGLPFLEAAAAQRPLIARELPNIAPDLHQFGFRFPQQYPEVWIPTGLFDWKAEFSRQLKRYRVRQQHLPAPCRRMAALPALLSNAKPAPIPFSRLTLTAQLEVLEHPADQTFAASADLNPFLAPWHHLAQQGRLKVTPWPRNVDRWLGGKAYAERFAKAMASAQSEIPPPDHGQEARERFVASRLDSNHQFPLLWSENP